MLGEPLHHAAAVVAAPEALGRTAVLLAIGVLAVVAIALQFLKARAVYGNEESGASKTNCDDCGARVPVEAEACEYCGAVLGESSGR